ncbi:MAG: heat-inducible transcription repressor HrcA [Lachnospiraceae bacterium]|nr:heat-inducible transcription repressor HrcA [Lachnospiraceae bacterium]
MQLNERKLQILQAIIMNYLETAEPVGSRTISRHFLTELSSATIRNEMSDLEEMGLIEQPHTSAGRVPSSKGYRLYVDELMHRQEMDQEQLVVVRDILRSRTMQLDSLLREIGDLLATLTKYTAVVSMPQIKKVELKHIQLMPLDEKTAILVVVTDGNIVRNHMIPLQQPLQPQELYYISDVLNRELSGLSLSAMDLSLIQKIKKELRLEAGTMDSLLDAINDTLQYADDVDTYTAGATNILNFPEFSDIAKARSLMDFLNGKDQMKYLSGESSTEKSTGSGLQIRIGKENVPAQLHDCSIVTANYRYNDQNIGSISIVGPMRMDYDRVVSALENLMKDFPDLFAGDIPKIIQEDKHDTE